VEGCNLRVLGDKPLSEWGSTSFLAASLNLINGFTGEFSLGHAGFMAVGAYCRGCCHERTSGFPFPLAIIVGMLGAAVAGVIVGLPTLRLRGDYLAIATLGFGEIVQGGIDEYRLCGRGVRAEGYSGGG
jgi:branched-chain amino acid transport system permease protein